MEDYFKCGLQNELLREVLLHHLQFGKLLVEEPTRLQLKI